MSIKDNQKEVDDWVQQFNLPYWPALEQLARLTEETGEVAREINHLHGTKKKKPEERTQELRASRCNFHLLLYCKQPWNRFRA